ncbi:MAG TPA: LacI family DNA-binding transcriptional regulator [Mycobacteriales bacterium]|nr:LacI family DNA-binding transcriptional regulator [Mycobacteriales bacterium]
MAGKARQESRNPTIRDVAAAAAVSRGTVSRVLNGGQYVSAGSLAAVQKAIRETGYVINHSARSLARRQTDCIAFVLSEPQKMFFEDPNFDVLLRSTTHVLADHDRTVVIMIAGDDQGRERVLRYARGGHIDGAILVSTHAGDPLVKSLPTGPIPVVSCGRTRARGSRIPYAAADDRGGAILMTRYLLDLGRRKVCTIAGPTDMCSGIDRLSGYRAALRGKGMPPHIVAAADYSVDSGADCMEELLRVDPDLDAVFIASDLLAAGAIMTLRRHGRRIGTDVAVGGFDDSRIAQTTDPPLTTIRQPLPQIAAETSRMLLRLIEGEEVEPVVLPTELIRRDSA